MKKRKSFNIGQDLLEDNSNLEWSDKGDSIAVSTVVSSKKSNKKFFSELDSFFESAMDDLWNESKEQVPEKIATEIKEHTSKPGKKSFFSGFDALFSSTSADMPETRPLGDGETAYMKRVTFLFKKDKLEELKHMAKKEKLYLRDIISKVLDDYLANKIAAEEKNK
ncbi:MAG TPA: hypothetical protein VK590_10000 [Saprospiraceae bacterium]|nr:hypothetical protein [Saprospiraceae bacterium]